MSDARSVGVDFIVAYYVGHSVINQRGRVAALQGGIVEAELRAAGNASAWPGSESFLPIAELHAALSDAGVPFLLFVDGCMEQEQARAAVAEGGFILDPGSPGSMDYVGPKELLSPRDFEVITTTLTRFGDNERYLRDDNAAIFAAKPGTLAMARPHPSIVGGPSVAPLASKLWQSSSAGQLKQGDALSFFHVLHGMHIWQGLGEIGFSGAISWSNLQAREEVARRMTVGGYGDHGDARAARRAGLRPGLGPIEEFAWDAAKEEWVLLIHTQDERGVNRWSVWRWHPQRGASRVVEEALFAKLGFGEGRAFLYSEPEAGERVDWLPPREGDPQLKEDEDVREIGTGYAAKSVIVIDSDNIVQKGGDRLRRWTGAGVETLLTTELTDARNPVEWAPDRFAWLDSDTDGAVVFAEREGSLRKIVVTGDRLMALAAVSDGVVVCNEKRTRLWRIPQSGSPTVAVLMDPEQRPLVHFEFGFGAMHRVGDVLWFASADQLVGFDLLELSWEAAVLP